jgi:hypothetical protein
LTDGTKIIYQDEFLKISWIPADSTEIVLCFTGIGHSLGGIDIQQQEFAGTGLRLGTPVFITDKTRSWGNRVDFELVKGVLQPIIQSKSVIALGNSMGAFLAIAASTTLQIRQVIAFAPQFSVDPIIMPDETRWMKYRDKITEFRIPSLKNRFSKDCSYYVFVGDDPVERMHWRHIPFKKNIYCFVAPSTHHDVAAGMKSQGILESAIMDCRNPALSESDIAARYGFSIREPEKH